MSAMLSPEFLADPYPFYAMLRSQRPVLWVPDMLGVGAWVVTGYSACSSALRNKQLGKEAARVVPPEKLAQIPFESPDAAARRKNDMLFTDPPRHTRLRGLVSQAFTPRTVERLRGHVAQIADYLLEQAAPRGQADLIRDFAFPLPVIVIAEMLGVPPEDRDQFKAWSSDMIASLSPVATPQDIKRLGAAIEMFDVYFRRIIEARRREPRADLISDLVRAQDAGDKLTMDEMLGTCRLLLAAGHETTVNLICNGALALFRNPKEREALAADPSLLPGAVEEILRYDSPVQLTVRFAMEDTEVSGQGIKRGDAVLAVVGAGNHDPAQFSDPDRLDIRRENAQSHLSLGGGVHYCLGAPLARLEGQIAIGALLRRYPGAALSTAPLEWNPNPTIRGLKELPITL
jgi:cytochrome P450